MRSANQSATECVPSRESEPTALDDSRFSSASWCGRIPVGTVDVVLPLFGATAPAPLLPAQPEPRQFFEPMVGLAMREMFETAVFRNLVDPVSRPEMMAFSRAR